MTERDRVLDAFRNCITEPKCKDCPWTECETIGNGTIEIPRDLALAVMRELVAQEPRVVKMSELTAGEPMLVWLEDIDKEETVAGMIFDYVPGRLGFKLTDLASRDRIYPRIEDYLTRWRCWTSRPDKATREATPWQGFSNL